MRMTRTILVVAATAGLLAGGARAGKLTDDMPIRAGWAKEMSEAWNAVVMVLAKYASSAGDKAGEIKQAGNDYIVRKTSSVADVQGKCDALLTDFDRGCSALLQAYMKSEGKITVTPGGGSTGYVEDKRGIGEWTATQREVIRNIPSWYIPYVQWCRGVSAHSASLQDATVLAPRKFEELHKQMARADKVLKEARADCKVGSESQIKQHIRHVARARAGVANVQACLQKALAGHEAFYTDTGRLPYNVKVGGQDTIGPVRAVNANVLVFNILRGFHDPSGYQLSVTSLADQYKQRWDACAKAMEPLTKQTAFEDLESFKGVRLSGLVKAVDDVEAHCKKVLEEHRKKYNTDGK